MLQQGHQDSNLTEAGARDAARAGTLLKDVWWDYCLASDLGRAATTAGIIRDLSCVNKTYPPLEFSENLRERHFGIRWEYCLKTNYI